MSNLTGSRETEGDMKQRVLSLLKAAPGTYISGEEISQVLGITRSAVWKHMEHLREEGYVIDSVSRKGYKILSAPDLLYPAEILEGLDTKVLAGRSTISMRWILPTTLLRSWLKKVPLRERLSWRKSR